MGKAAPLRSKPAEESDRLERAKSHYKGKTADQVRALLQKGEGSWTMPVPIAWTIHLFQICRGAAQAGLIMRIWAYTGGAPKKDWPDDRHKPEWSPKRTALDYSLEVAPFSRDTMADAVDDAVARGLIERKGSKEGTPSFYQYKLCPAAWPTIEPVNVNRTGPGPKPIPAPSGERQSVDLEQGKPTRLRRGWRYIPTAPIEEVEYNATSVTATLTEGILKIEGPEVEEKAADKSTTSQESAAVSLESTPTKTEATPTKLKLADFPEFAKRARGTANTQANFANLLVKKCNEAIESEQIAYPVTDTMMCAAFASASRPNMRTPGLMFSTMPIELQMLIAQAIVDNEVNELRRKEQEVMATWAKKKPRA